MATTSLSTIRPDFEQLVTQLQTILQTKPAWTDLFRSGTGQTIIEMIANVGAMDQYAIEMAYKQGFLDSALTDSAVYAIARMLGVRLPRKLPCTMAVTLNRSGSASSLTIPPYSEFSCDGATLFNRQAIVFGVGVTTQTATLYEGTVRTFSLTATGTDFQMFTSAEQGFQVSDQDVRVVANSSLVEVGTYGIWNARDQDVVNDSTTKDGELLLTFGNDQFGFKPATSTVIDITYVVTEGVDAADAALAGKAVTYLADPSIQGPIGSGGLTGGGEPADVDTMRKVGPQIFSANNYKATTKSEFSAIASQYPGVLDALVVGQHEYAPTDVRYMNLVRVTLLTETPFTTPQWNDFSDWYRQRIMYPVRFFRQDPIAVDVPVTAKIYCSNAADLNEVRANVQAALDKLFAASIGKIGFNVYRSDVYNAIQDADPRIIYLELLAPTTDVIVDIQSPTTINIVDQGSGGGGTLTPGQYMYGVSALNASGESLVTNFITLNKTQVGANSLTWSAVSGATSYRVYGRLAATPGLLYTTAGLLYTDPGTDIPGLGLPALDTSGVHYARAGAINLSMLYTQRS